MRRTTLACLVILLAAPAAFAANPYYLDRNGVLWQATAAADGMVLTGQKDGTEIVRSVVPFPVMIAGTTDTQIQVAADELTGKVAVVWQRNWSYSGSEIMLAVWRDGNWERTQTLSGSLAANPRNPAIRLTEVSLDAPDPSDPTNPAKTVQVQDSYLNVVWWEGNDQPHGTYALLRLSGDPSESDSLLEQNLDTYATLGLPCGTPVPPAVLEHPVFASDGTADRAVLFFGSQRQCLFQLLQVSFVLDSSPQAPAADGGMTASTQRRRSVPIFGVTKVFALTQALSMDNARVILGSDLNPVAYRVDGSTIQYVTYGNDGWSPAHTLAVANGLTLDQAIPLVENLAR